MEDLVLQKRFYDVDEFCGEIKVNNFREKALVPYLVKIFFIVKEYCNRLFFFIKRYEQLVYEFC